MLEQAALRTHDVKIGDFEFQFEVLKVGPASDLFVRLTKLMGPGFADGLRMTGPGLRDGLVSFCERLTLVDLVFIQNTLKASCTVTYGDQVLRLSQGSTFDDVFAGRIFLMWQWVAAGVRYNFADFFDAAQAEWKKLDGLARTQLAQLSLQLASLRASTGSVAGESSQAPASASPPDKSEKIST